MTSQNGPQQHFNGAIQLFRHPVPERAVGDRHLGTPGAVANMAPRTTRDRSSHNRIVFISTMVLYRWGGSEELWSRAALDLAGRGVPVAASIAAWSPLHP